VGTASRVYKNITYLTATWYETATPGVTVMEKRNKLWVLLGVLILALLNFPLLTIVNRDLCYGGIPLLIYYLFGVWLLAIGILAWGSRFLAP
jgi:hypothetical protein